MDLKKDFNLVRLND